MNLNLENKQYGRLTVIQKLETRRTSGGNPVARWLCKCLCGSVKIVSTNSLRQGKVKSCGCLNRELVQQRGFQNKTHGGYSQRTSVEDRIKWQALKNIYERTQRRGYESDLDIDDLPELTDMCPILGIRYKKGSLKCKDASPSIDRKNPNLPYLKKYKDNLAFISYRANRIKADATVEELKSIINYMGSPL
jgi:hypothetical protein